jgi:hypothetical protein
VIALHAVRHSQAEKHMPTRSPQRPKKFLRNAILQNPAPQQEVKCVC